MAAAAGALFDEGQPIETAWPYTPNPITPWTPPMIASAFHKATLAPGMLGYDGIIAALDAGAPVVLGLVITDAFFRPDALGLVADVVPDIERGGCEAFQPKAYRDMPRIRDLRSTRMSGCGDRIDVAEDGGGHEPRVKRSSI